MTESLIKAKKPLTRLETLFGVFSMHAIPHLTLSSCEPDCFANYSNALPASVMRWNFSSESIQSATRLSGSFTSEAPCYQDTGMTVTQHSLQQKWPNCIIYIYVCYIDLNNTISQTIQLSVKKSDAFVSLSQSPSSQCDLLGLKDTVMKATDKEWKSCCGGRELMRNWGGTCVTGFARFLVAA